MEKGINFGSAERFPSNIKDSVNLKIMFVREPVISYKVSTETEADSCVDSELQEEVFLRKTDGVRKLLYW